MTACTGATGRDTNIVRARKVAHPLRLKRRRGQILEQHDPADLSGIEITKVRQVLNSRRLEWDTYLPRHPAYTSLLESPQQRIATDWKAEGHSTRNLYHLEM